MIVSDARREANRRHAQRSSALRTEASQTRSRQNALTHGLSAEVVPRPEADPAVAADPAVDWAGFLVEQANSISARLRRCDGQDRRHRARISLRAETFWDEDRRLEVEFLGSGIAKDPASVARSLRMSPQGCDWLIERWSLLARAADRDGAWTAEQTSLAFDLLGRPSDLRSNDPTETINLDGKPSAPDGDLAGLARREVTGLLARKTQVEPLDALDREGARTDPDARDDLDLRRLHRHEADLHRRLRWCVAQLAKAQSQSEPEPEHGPRPEAFPPRPGLPGLPPLNLDDLPADPTIEEMVAIMAQVANLRRSEAPQPAAAQPPPQPQPSRTRPDPKAALQKARAERRRDR